MDEDFEERIDYYISIGVIELAGIDEDGEAVYEILPAAEIEAPELWQAHTEYVDNALVDLFEKGLITVEYNENLEAIINMTPEGYEAATQMGLNLDMHEEEEE